MGKKQRKVYIHHEPSRTFVASAHQQSRIHQIHIEAPPVQFNAPEPGQSTIFDIALGKASIAGDAPNFASEVSVEDSSGIVVKTKAKRYTNSDAPLLTWKQEYRQEYLDSSLLNEGRGRLWNVRGCSRCHAADPVFRCRDCYGLRPFCHTCAIEAHRDSPLHVLEKWNGDFFNRVSLQNLGLRFQLGHARGVVCPHSSRGHVDFVVIHHNGIHILNLDFCGCLNAPQPRHQLLEVGWWPSSPIEPQSAATFDVLRQFHVMNLQGCIPATDFYRSLEQLTEGEGLKQLPDRLAQFMLIIREWRHIKMLKRAGRGHDTTGINGTKQGELSIPCRACPHPGINLPPGWESAPPEIRWIYALILEEDANFKQKGRLRSTDAKDPALGPGWATFVNTDEYLNHLKNYIHQDEISHCVGFAALWSANNKRSKGLRATGVGSVSCSRHEMFRPNGMGDLQKGERYANMDYIFLSSIIGTMLLLLTVTYDIACQWSKNFMSRMAAVPSHLHTPSSLQIRFRVPKFHLAAHKENCHSPFSLNFTKWVGRTDGEGVERLWSWLNKVARSVSVMGPGGRQDTLDDFCNFSNWRKTLGIGDSLLRKLILAIPEAIIHHRAFRAFTDSLREQHSDELAQWEKEVKEWEDDQSKPCPFDLPADDVRLTDVKKQLAEEEHRRVERGDRPPTDVSPSGFIIAGLEIEEQQQNIQVEARKTTLSSIESTNLQTRRTNLLKKIQKFRDSQTTYMPGLPVYLEARPVDYPTGTPESIPLHLPSSFDNNQRSIVCATGLASIEDRLRFAQATEALANLRRQLRTRSFAHKYQSRNIDSQGPYTRSRELQDGIEVRIKAARTQYSVARLALVALRGDGDWQSTLKLLTAEDIRGINERTYSEEEKEAYRRTRLMAGLTEEAVEGELNGDGIAVGLENVPTIAFNRSLALGEGRRTLSWIWYTVSDEELEGSAEVQACLRVEWVKARARADRWREELVLLEEEMRRSVEFCWWKAGYWSRAKSTRAVTCDFLAEGMRAYAAQQGDIERRRAMRWTLQWEAVRTRAKEVLERQLGHTVDRQGGQVSTLTVELAAGDEDECDDDDDGDNR